MESRARLLGHSVHQMLVTFPIGAFGFSVALDSLYTLTHRREHARAARMAIDFGLVTAGLAIPFGLIDYLGIQSQTRAKRVGLAHGLGNAAVAGLFVASRLMRCGAHAPARARMYSAVAFSLAGVTAWLGGELIARHGIGINDEVGQDLPSSLSKNP